MQRSFLFGIGGLVIGLAVGFWAANNLNRNAGTGNTGGPSLPGMMNSGPGQDDIQALLDLSEKEPENFAVQMRTGDLYAQIGRFESAIEFYKRGLALRPEDPAANLVLGNAYFDARQFENAAVQYEKVIGFDPENHNARSDLAGSLIEKPSPEYDRALKELEKVLVADPKNEAALYYTAVVYIRKGEQAKAKEAAEQLSKTSPESHLVTRLTQMMEQK